VRDNTEDWVIPRGTVPTLNQLEARIDEALVLARASEDGVREVGDLALDAARQARRAAEAAEESARAAVQAASQAPVSRDDALGPAGPVAGREVEVEARAEPARQPRFEVRFRSFNERADRLSARLRRLQAQSGHSSPSVGAVRRRGDG
jgi:hypothetical protein